MTHDSFYKYFFLVAVIAGTEGSGSLAAWPSQLRMTRMQRANFAQKKERKERRNETRTDTYPRLEPVVLEPIIDEVGLLGLDPHEALALLLRAFLLRLRLRVVRRGGGRCGWDLDDRGGSGGDDGVVVSVRLALFGGAYFVGVESGLLLCLLLAWCDVFLLRRDRYFFLWFGFLST